MTMEKQDQVSNSSESGGQPGTVDQEKLNQFLGRFVADLGAALHAPTVIIGDKLGLYRAMAGAGELTSSEIASRTGTSERYVREWLASQAASGYVMYNHLSKKYWLTPEQAFTLADEASPAYLPGAFYIAASVFKDEPHILEAFKTGKGLGWHEHDSDLFTGTEKFFRPGYAGNLVSSWLPALDGVVPMLERGGRVAAWAAGTGRRRSSWRRPTRTRRSSAMTITVHPSRRQEGRRRDGASVTGSGSRSRPRAPILETGSTW
jgi:hypothetical protein